MKTILVSLIVIISIPLFSQIPIIDLRFYYPMNESAEDFTGNDENGVTTSKLFGLDRFGKEGKSFYSSPSDAVGIRNFKDHNNPQNFSLSYWFKLDTSITNHDSDKQIILSAFADYCQYLHDRMVVMNSDGTISVSIYSLSLPSVKRDTLPTTKLSYKDNEWHYLNLSLSSENGLSLYMDDQIVIYDSTIKVADSKYGFWKFGGVLYEHKLKFVGFFDDIRYYNKLLDTNEIYELYSENRYLDLNTDTITVTDTITFINTINDTITFINTITDTLTFVNIITDTITFVNTITDTVTFVDTIFVSVIDTLDRKRFLVNTVQNDIRVVKIYPNPTTDYLIVETNFQDSFYTFSLINESGMNVYQDTFYDNRFEIDVLDLEPGLYYICISNEDRSFVESRKIVVQ